MVNLPTYLVGHLARHLPALEAAEQQTAITTALMPVVDRTSRNDVMRSLDRRTESLRPAKEPLHIEVIEHDPAKAKAYFESLGIYTTAKD